MRVLVLLVLPIAGTALAADGIQGLWEVEDGEAHVEVAGCGDNLCGRIVWLKEPHYNGEPKRDHLNPDPALRGREVVGLRILEKLSKDPNRRGYWTGGRIYDPETGKTYRCKVSLQNPDRLRMRGFIGFSLLGRTTYWRRVGRVGSSPSKQRNGAARAEGLSSDL